MPKEIVCPECEDQDERCEHCGGRGHFLLTECPSRAVDQEIRDLCPLADLFKEGLPPAPGGSMDQTNWFVSAAMRLFSDENKIEAAKNCK